ncbi:MAG: hypothetical protein EA423_10565 [Phycisphaerales bacterium]|nr:MAG: hypothetical protein EA423_10565 [Phycisphaerales bacterium]
MDVRHRGGRRCRGPQLRRARTRPDDLRDRPARPGDRRGVRPGPAPDPLGRRELPRPRQTDRGDGLARAPAGPQRGRTQGAQPAQRA